MSSRLPFSPVSSANISRAYGRKMSETETRTQPQAMQTKHLALANLRSVRWVATQPPVKSGYEWVAPRYRTLRKAAILGWIIVFYEVAAVWWWTFLHGLPWPQVLLSSLDFLDSRLCTLLDSSQQKLEWWWDASGVRLMWLKESALNTLDRYVTKIDAVLLRLQDLLISVFGFLLRPAVSVYQVVAAPAKRLLGGRPQRRVNHDSDWNDDEDAEEMGEDYLSDGSSDSRRILKNDPRGVSYNRQCTTVMAEGKFREAMYHRVKKELRLMRKNSIRISYGIVNYAKQMVEPRVRPYADSFQASYRKWEREHEIQELVRPLQEEWSSDRRPLAKVLSLARALCVVCLAFLLRLAKGKKSRRTRSMRSESLRRRAQNLVCTSNSPLPLSPTALQQSSEPAPSHHLEVPESLQEPALKEDDEDLDGSPAKDSALGSEDQLDSDHTVSPIDEEHDSEEESTTKPEAPSGAGAKRKDSDNSVIKREDEEQMSPKQKKGVTIMTPKPQNSPKQKKHHKYSKKIMTIG